jgi:hypothetical protein
MQRAAHQQACEPCGGGGGGEESINTMNQALLNNQKNLTRMIKMLSVIYLTCIHKDCFSYYD